MYIPVINCFEATATAVGTGANVYIYTCVATEKW